MVKLKKTTAFVAAATGATMLTAVAASAVTLNITITNNSAPGGVTLTPLYTAFHDGSFDAFTVGETASPGLELLAEDGDASGIAGERQMDHPNSQGDVILAPGGFAGAPVIEAGETASISIDVDGATNPFFTYLSMILPSNDQFIGNGDPMAHQLFDAGGNFLGPQTIEVTGLNVYDAGTEQNIGDGAPFQGAFGGPAQDEGGTVQLGGGIDVFDGINLPDGNVLSAALSNYAGNGDFSIASIQIEAVPVPAALPLMLGGFGLLGFAARRRKNA
jgi:hypothetical protein